MIIDDEALRFHSGLNADETNLTRVTWIIVIVTFSCIR